MITRFLRPEETILLALLPGWIGAVVVLFNFGLVYLALLYFAFRRRYVLPKHFHILSLVFGVLIVLSATLYSWPTQIFKLPTFIFSWFAFLTCLLGAYLCLAAVDLFITDYYLGTVRRIYISPPMRKLIRLIAFSIAALVSMDIVFNFNPSTRLASLGVGGLALGLALQDTLKGIIGGLSLGRLLRIGDWVRIKGMDGQVIDLDWGRLTLLTPEGGRIYIPNKELQQSDFLNYSRCQKSHQAKLEVSVSGSADPQGVKTTLIDVAQKTPGVLKEPVPDAFILSFGDSGILYGVFFWVDDYVHLRKAIDGVANGVWTAFRQKGFEIPFPTRTVYMRQETH